VTGNINTGYSPITTYNIYV
jgi:hypothetical protein